MYTSGDNEYFEFTRFGPLPSFYLKLINGSIGINVAKLNMKEFKYEINRLKGKKAKKQTYKIDKRDGLENAEALYNGLNIIIEAYKNRIFESKYRPNIDVDNNLSNNQESDSFSASDPNIYESHNLTDRELQMFRRFFGYGNPEELKYALIGANSKKKCNEILNDHNIKQTVLRDQIKTKIGVSRTRLENLVKVAEDILDRTKLYNNMPELESEESAKQ